MPDWKVSRCLVEVMPHPNADKLELLSAGGYQLVSQKGRFKTGDIAVLIPDKSVLPDVPEFESFKPYLRGVEKNRVQAQKMRGELSCGILIDDRPELAHIPLDQDISELIGVKEYVPVVPAGLAGRVKPVGSIDTFGAALTHHDVAQFGVNAREFSTDEEVFVTEKLHGSQNITMKLRDGKRLVTSKGLFKRYLTLEEEENNAYWKAARKTSLYDIIDWYWEGKHVQVFSEIIPCQGAGFSYGQKEITLRIFRVDVEGKTIPYDELPLETRDLWVPILHRGKFDIPTIRALAKGNETVSGKEMHIREGVVVSPVVPRLSVKGQFPLYCKVINENYKETGEEFN